MTSIGKAGRLVAVLALVSSAASAQKKGEVAVWLTNPDKSALFERQKEVLHFHKAAAQGSAIEIDERRKYQPTDGFGYALTGGSAQHLIRMEQASRAAILRELFATAGNLSLIHISEPT